MRNSLLGDTPSGGDASYSLADAESGGLLSKPFSTASPPPVTRRTFTLLLITLSILAIIVLGLALALVSDARSRTDGGDGGGGAVGNYIGSGVQQADLWRHLSQLQRIADENGGTRAIGHPGFNATIAYINSVLSDTDYDVVQQPFSTVAWYQGPPSVSLTIGSVTNAWRYQTDYHVLTYSGSVLATAAPVYAVANAGCAADDYAAVNFTSGGVALMPAGVCGNAAKVTTAASAGAVAVLIYQSRSTRTFLPGGVGEGAPIGAFLLMYDMGVALAEAVYGRQGAVTAAMNLSTSIGPTGVSNVCATTRYGDKSNTIVSGSHADSVPAGAGVNDNGSGTSLNLALALDLDAKSRQSNFERPANAIRFCWWAAEEVGLRGSQEFVRRAVAAGMNASAPVGERIPQDIQVNLNYDIVGSPNFVYGVWDGTTFTSPNSNTYRSVNGSLATTRLYEQYFNRSGLTYSYRPLDNRSDYKSFHDAGVAAGGATSGREDLKTLEERNRYTALLGAGRGGIPGVNYDPCYHQRCDMVWGVLPQAILNLTHAAGYVLDTLARMPDLRAFLSYPPRSNETEPSGWSDARKQSRMAALEEQFAASTKAFLSAHD